MVIAGSRKRRMRGGFLESLTASLTDAWNKTKTAASGAYDSATGSAASTYTPVGSSTLTYAPTTPTSTSTYTMGGRKRRRTRRMRGGNFTDNMPTTGLAAHAEPISGIPTAQPHNWVGGKRTRRHRRSKSRRRR
jgi:hypothetical protein